MKPLGPGAGQGAARARRGLRAGRGRRRAHAPAGGARRAASPASSAATPRWISSGPPLEQAGGGPGQVVAVVGEPGVGKSRLFYEFIHSHRTHGWLVLESSLGLLRQGDRLPAGHRPAQGLLQDRRPRRHARGPGQGDRHSADARRGARGSRPAAALRCSRRCPTTTRSWHSSPPSGASARWRRSSGCCCARARCSRCSLVFEDLHWIDAETQALLDSLVESLPTAAMLLAVNYRPEYQHGWGSKTYYAPAPARSAAAGERRRAAARPCSASDPSVGPLQAPADRADGGQSALPRGERADPGGDADARRRARRLPPREGPGRRSRCRRRSRRSWPRASTGCPPSDKRLLQAASVVGKDVPFASAPGDRRPAERRAAAPGSPSCRPASSSTRRRCFPISSTPSSTP